MAICTFLCFSSFCYLFSWCCTCLGSAAIALVAVLTLALFLAITLALVVTVLAVALALVAILLIVSSHHRSSQLSSQGFHSTYYALRSTTQTLQPSVVCSDLAGCWLLTSDMILDYME
jgi:hypothetical protein